MTYRPTSAEWAALALCIAAVLSSAWWRWTNFKWIPLDCVIASLAVAQVFSLAWLYYLLCILREEMISVCFAGIELIGGVEKRGHN